MPKFIQFQIFDSENAQIYIFVAEFIENCDNLPP